MAADRSMENASFRISLAFQIHSTEPAQSQHRTSIISAGHARFANCAPHIIVCRFLVWALVGAHVMLFGIRHSLRLPPASTSAPWKCLI